MTLQELFQKAKNEGFAVGAFNAGDIVTIKAIVQAAANLHSAVIVESSMGEVKFIGLKNLTDIITNFKAETGLPIFVNLDHCSDLGMVDEGLDADFDLIHFDGSSLSLEENNQKTKQIVERAHAKGILVEAEMDKIGGESKVHHSNAESAQAVNSYTDPVKAAEFVKATGADILAAFVGNVHGVYKNPIKLDLERLRLITKQTYCFLSLHGGSGIPTEEIQQAIKIGGIVKINVNTELRVAYRQALERGLAENEETAVYKLMDPVVRAVQSVVEEKIKMFGSEGKA